MSFAKLKNYQIKFMKLNKIRAETRERIRNEIMCYVRARI